MVAHAEQLVNILYDPTPDPNRPTNCFLKTTQYLSGNEGKFKLCRWLFASFSVLQVFFFLYLCHYLYKNIQLKMSKFVKIMISLLISGTIVSEAWIGSLIIV